MLDHLIDFEPEVGAHPGAFVPLDDADTAQIIDGKVNTSDWLSALGAVDDKQIADQAQAQSARKAFSTIVSASPQDITHTALAQVKTPEAVKHLVGMLTAYDWEFVEQAKELRGYTVAKLVEESQNPSANIRLKALALLGKVTEVGLFTEKIEVKKTELSDEEIEQRIKDKLNRFMGVVDVVEATEFVDEGKNLQISGENSQETPEIPSETPDAA